MGLGRVIQHRRARPVNLIVSFREKGLCGRSSEKRRRLLRSRSPKRLALAKWISRNDAV